MTATDWRLYVRDRNVLRVGEIDDFGSFSCIMRDNDLGTWTFDLPVDSQYLPYLDPDESGGFAGIVLTADGVPQFSGPVRTLTLTATTARVSGVCDNWVMARFASIPNPSGPVDPDALPAVGVASTILRSFVNGQTGDLINFPTRHVPQITYSTDPLVGTVDMTIPRYTPLLTACQQIALAGGGLRFWFRQSIQWSPAYVEMIVEQRRDLRADVTFSMEQGTLEDFEHTRQSASANVVYAVSGAGGEADGVTEISPVFSELDQQSINRYGRIETFLSVAQTNDATKVRTEMLNALDEGGDRRSVKLTPIETVQLRFGVEYGLGDLVLCQLPDGALVDAVIREVEIAIDAQRAVSITPLIGTAGMSNDPTTTQIVRQLNDRVQLLERSTGSIGQIRRLDGTVGSLNDALADIETTLNATTFIGEMKVWPGASSPASNWMLCQGQSLLRATYSTLFSILSTTYGAADGTHFNLPDLRGRMALGVSGGHVLGESAGAETFNNQHHHGINHDHGGATDQSAQTTSYFAGTIGPFDRPSTDHVHPIPDETGDSSDAGSTTQSVLNPFLAVNYIIRVL